MFGKMVRPVGREGTRNTSSNDQKGKTDGKQIWWDPAINHRLCAPSDDNEDRIPDHIP